MASIRCFYGQDALKDALAELLPEAESNAIYQLIDDQDVASAQLGNLYRDVGRRYISAFAVIAATLAAVPLPFCYYASAHGATSFDGGCAGPFVWPKANAVAGRGRCKCDRRRFFLRRQLVVS